MDRNNKNIKVLDIGTGPGFFVILMTSIGVDTTAMDYNGEMLNKAKENSGEYNVNRFNILLIST